MSPSDDVPTMDQNPFSELLGIEIIEMSDGHAVSQLEMRPELSSNPNSIIAHGGVTYSLADHTGGAAVVSLGHMPTPTVDMRIDYLKPVTSDLRAEAKVIRAGGSVAAVAITVSDSKHRQVAVAQGVYKAGGSEYNTPWTEGFSTE